MTPAELRLLLNLWMVADPWPRYDVRLVREKP